MWMLKCQKLSEIERHNPKKNWEPLACKLLNQMLSIKREYEWITQRTLIDRCSLCLQRAIELLMSEWHIWLCYTASRKAVGIQICTFHLCQSCLFLYQASQSESWGLSPSFALNPEQRFQENSTKKKNIQFQIFQYYMITLRFPLLQSDQSVQLCDSNSLVSLTEESYSGKTLAAWVNNSVLAGAETDRLCGSSVFLH